MAINDNHRVTTMSLPQRVLGDCEGSTTVERVVRGGPSAEVTSGQKPKGKEGVSYRVIWDTDV